MSDKLPENSRAKKQVKRRKKKRIFLYISIPILIFLLASVTYGYKIYSTAQNTVENSYEEVGRENETSELRKDKVNPVEDNVSVLIIGVDDSEERDYDEKSRSDALILATFNKQEENIKLVSIPRDTYTFVPERNTYTKINHAHFFGGPKATIETVENFLNVPVDYYVRLNFDAFIEVVDSLGGIYFDVPYEMTELDSEDNEGSIHLEPGYQKLNGEEALAVARTRKYDNDIKRGYRQQEIIKAIVKEATSASSLLKLENIITAVGDHMATNLSFDELKSFASYGMNTDVDITSVKLEGSGGYMDDGLWYYQVDDESKTAISNELRNHLDLQIQESIETELSVDDNKEIQPYTY
ncbi:LCP family protein [Oceanobacillus senegalensis]|uniref:LCP family protein n=1 Tax=Oceanobacillus senegalensis TaxID=1936063 RepID=UPI000A304A94|nr:LCP family protein [Oceanobacillus senegalensis]